MGQASSTWSRAEPTTPYIDNSVCLQGLLIRGSQEHRFDVVHGKESSSGQQQNNTTISLQSSSAALPAWKGPAPGRVLYQLDHSSTNQHIFSFLSNVPAQEHYFTTSEASNGKAQQPSIICVRSSFAQLGQQQQDPTGPVHASCTISGTRTDLSVNTSSLYPDDILTFYVKQSHVTVACFSFALSPLFTIPSNDQASDCTTSPLPPSEPFSNSSTSTCASRDLAFASPLLPETDEEPIQDSPLFRAVLSQLEEKCHALRKNVKAAVKASEKQAAQLHASLDAQAKWYDVLAELCDQDPLRPLYELFFAPRRDVHLKQMKEEAQILQDHLIKPLRDLSGELKESDALRRAFDLESKMYYDFGAKVSTPLSTCLSRPRLMLIVIAVSRDRPGSRGSKSILL